MLFGIGLMLYLLTLLAEVMLRTVTDPHTAQRRKERKIMTLKDHTSSAATGRWVKLWPPPWSAPGAKWW